VHFEAFNRTPAFFTIHLKGFSSPQPEDFEEMACHRTGYYHYQYRYDEARFKTGKSAAEEFLFNVVWELDLLYRAVRAKKHRARDWSEVTWETEKILDAYQGSGLRNYLQRLWQGRRINQALISLARIEVFQRREIQTLHTEFDTDYKAANTILIKAPVADALNDLDVIPVEPLSSLLELFDARRNTARGVAIATMASLIGAAVAAVATLIVAG